jgi:hypothetical protein
MSAHANQIEPFQAAIQELYPEVSTNIPELGSEYSVEGGKVELLHTGYAVSPTEDAEISTKGMKIQTDILSSHERKRLAKATCINF